MGLADCAAYSGRGEIIPATLDTNTDALWSQKFRWLPCEITFGSDREAKITSYINLDPQKYKGLYKIIEQIITKSVVMWNNFFTFGAYPPWTRIDHIKTEYEFPLGHKRPDTKRGLCEKEVEELDEMDEEDLAETVQYDPETKEEAADLDEQWKVSNRVLVRPEPIGYRPARKLLETEILDLGRIYKEHGLQVIVKLANICLTPVKPNYDGGSCHVEGMMNEHIIATSLYYYDSQNVTANHLWFRQAICQEDLQDFTYDQDDYAGVEELYGIDNEGP